MAKAKEQVKEVPSIKKRLVTVRLVGISPLIQHKWSEKAKELIRDKQQLGKKTKNRDLRDPKAEGEAAMHRTEDGKPGILAVAIKAAVIEAAHQDLGIPRTLVRKSMFIYPMGRDVVIPLETAVPSKKDVPYEIEEDVVRIGAGSADLRYRPYFYDWAVTTTWELDSELLKDEDLLRLLDRAGFGVGLHEWRPEKGGEYGRFKIDTNFKVKTENI